MLNKLYTVKALYSGTNRIRTIHKEAYDVIELTDLLIKEGFVEPFEIIERQYEPPSEAQMNLAKDLEIVFPSICNKRDATAILSRHLDYDNRNPNPELVEFANDRKISFSEYEGKKALYDIIWSSLNEFDKLAFFCFSVYRHLSDDRRGNLDKHPYRERFISFAEFAIKDERACKSIFKYQGSEVRTFGSYNGKDGFVSNGGSVNTIGYKLAKSYLEANVHIEKNVNKNSQNGTKARSQPIQKPLTKDEYLTGCLGFVIVILIFLFFIWILS